MPRRFAILLLTVLALLAAGLTVVLLVKSRGQEPATLTANKIPTPVIPPTPIPPKRVLLYFESPEDELFHPETRDIASSADDIALIRTVTAAVLEGPYRKDLLAPFPQGWTTRAAYRLPHGLVVIDLTAPKPPKPAAAPSPVPGAAPRPVPAWESGSREEWSAIQAVCIAVARNVPEVKKVLFTVGGEPVETLAGHIDLTHPIAPLFTLLSEEAPGLPPETPTPTPTATPAPPVTPSPTNTPGPTPKPKKTALPTPDPLETPVEGY